MITRFSKALCAAALAALSLTGCGSGETYPMASPEGLDRIKELIRTNVDTSKNKIYQVSWHEDRGDRKLENILTEVEAYYTDTENNDYRIAFTLTDGQFVTDGPKKSDRQYNSYECSTPLDLEAINLEYLKKICEEAEAMVKADEQGQKLTLRSAGMFRFRVWPCCCARPTAGIAARSSARSRSSWRWTSSSTSSMRTNRPNTRAVRS